MIVAILLVLELVFMMILVALVARGSKPGNPKTLGIFSYKDNKGDALARLRKKKNSA